MESSKPQPVDAASPLIDTGEADVMPQDEQHMTAQGTGVSRGATPQIQARPVLDPLNLGVLELVLFWCLWLLGSWAVTRMLMPTVLAGRLMVYAMLFGLLLLWPAYRLSQLGPHGQNAGQAGPQTRGWWCFLLDWLVLMIVMQAVIWPLGIVCMWPFGQLLAVNLTLASWALIIGQFIAWGSMSTRVGPRNLAMGLCLFVLLAQPVAVWLLGQGQLSWQWLQQLGPLAQITELTRPQLDARGLDLLANVWPIVAAGILGWALLLTWRVTLWFRQAP